MSAPELLTHRYVVDVTPPGFVAYLYSDEADHPIYVGYTSDLEVRRRLHRTQSWWWTPGLEVSYTPYPTEAEALAAEAALIRTLRPRHNKRLNNGPSSRLAKRGNPIEPPVDTSQFTRVSPHQLHTVRQVAEMVGASSSEIRNLLRTRQMPWVDIGLERSMPRIAATDIPKFAAHFNRLQEPATAAT